MPQLDPSTFISQLFWLFVAFALLWGGLKLMLPELGAIMRKRKQHAMRCLKQARELERQAAELTEAQTLQLKAAQGRARAQIDTETRASREALKDFRTALTRKGRQHEARELVKMREAHKKLADEVREKSVLLRPVLLAKIKAWYGGGTSSSR